MYAKSYGLAWRSRPRPPSMIAHNCFVSLLEPLTSCFSIIVFNIAERQEPVPLSAPLSE